MMRRLLVLLILAVSGCLSYLSFGMVIEDSFTSGWDEESLGSESAISPVSVSPEEFPENGTLEEVNQKIQDVEPVSPEVPEIPQNNLNPASEVPSELPAAEPAQSEIPFQQEENIVPSSIEDTARPSPKIPEQAELNPETASGKSPSIEERSGHFQERIIPPPEDVEVLPDEKEGVTDNSGDDVKGPEMPSSEEETLSSASVRDNDEYPSDGNEVSTRPLGVSFPGEGGPVGDVSPMPVDNPGDDGESRGMMPSDEEILPSMGGEDNPLDDGDKSPSSEPPGISPLGLGPSLQDTPEPSLMPEDNKGGNDKGAGEVDGVSEMPSPEGETLLPALVEDESKNPPDGDKIPAQPLGVPLPGESGPAGGVSPMPVDDTGDNGKGPGDDVGGKGMIPVPDRKTLPPTPGGGDSKSPPDDAEPPSSEPPGISPLGPGAFPQDTPELPPMPVDDTGDNDKGPGDDVGGKGMIPVPDRKTLPPTPGGGDSKSPPDDAEPPSSEPPGVSPLGPGFSPQDAAPPPPMPIKKPEDNPENPRDDIGIVIHHPKRRTLPPALDKEEPPDDGDSSFVGMPLPGGTVSPEDACSSMPVKKAEDNGGGPTDGITHKVAISSHKKRMLPPSIERDESNDESVSDESEPLSEGISSLGGIISSEDDSVRRLTLGSVDEEENSGSYQIASFPQKREEKLEGHNLSYVGSSYREKAGAVSSGEGYSREDSAEGKYSFMENNEEGIRVASLTTDFSSAIKSSNNIRNSASGEILEKGDKKIVMGSTPTERIGGVSEKDVENIPEPPEEVRKVVDDVVCYLEGYERTLRQNCRRNDNSECEDISQKIGVIRRSIKESLDEVISGVQEDMEGGAYAIKGRRNGWQLNYYVLPPDLEETRKLHRRDRK